MHRSLSARSRCSERALAASSLRRVRFSPSASAALSTRQTASRSDDVPSSPSLSGSSSAPPWSSSAFDLAVLMQPIGRDGAPNMADRYMKLPRFITAQGMREASGFPLGDGPPLLVTTSVVMHGATAWALLGGAATMPGGVELALGAGSFALRMFGITAGYHRYFAHGSYKTSRAFQFVLGVLGASAWQKGPLWWASHHVEHHLHSDQKADPHSPVSGSLLWAHMGWFWACMEFDRHPRAFREGRNRVARFAAFPELVALDRFHHGPGIALAALAYAADGVPGLLWGFVIPTVAAWHATFAVNSVCHRWGSRRFATTDNSRNNAFVAIAAFGEGNHNNHHAFPWSARHGLGWSEPDLSYAILRALERVGIVWDLKVPTPNQLERAQRSRRLRVSKQGQPPGDSAAAASTTAAEA